MPRSALGSGLLATYLFSLPLNLNWAGPWCLELTSAFYAWTDLRLWPRRFRTTLRSATTWVSWWSGKSVTIRHLAAAIPFAEERASPSLATWRRLKCDFVFCIPEVSVSSTRVGEECKSILSTALAKDLLNEATKLPGLLSETSLGSFGGLNENADWLRCGNWLTPFLLFAVLSVWIWNSCSDMAFSAWFREPCIRHFEVPCDGHDLSKSPDILALRVWPILLLTLLIVAAQKEYLSPRCVSLISMLDCCVLSLSSWSLSSNSLQRTLSDSATLTLVVLLRTGEDIELGAKDAMLPCCAIVVSKSAKGWWLPLLLGIDSHDNGLVRRDWPSTASWGAGVGALLEDFCLIDPEKDVFEDCKIDDTFKDLTDAGIGWLSGSQNIPVGVTDLIEFEVSAWIMSAIRSSPQV